MRNGFVAFAILGGVAAGLCGPARAETVMQQCGHQYQDAKAAGTLNGMTWNQFRSDCAARLKAQPAATAPAPATPAPATPAPATPAATQTQAANPLNPAPAAPATAAATPAAPAAAAGATPIAKPAPSAGRAAFLVREKQCGAEWRSNKATLTAQTPGLTWPKYLSQCNTRLKAAGK